MKKPEKNHDTGLRILEVLKLLLNNDISKNELILKLKDNSQVENVYTYEAFLKYFNTLEVFGLKLSKNKTKYKLLNALVELNLTSEEEKVFCKLINNLDSLNNKSDEEKMHNIIKRLDKYVEINLQSQLKDSIKRTSVINNNVRNNVVNTLKKLIYDNQDVNITYKKLNGSEEKILCVLKEIIEKDGNKFVICYNPKVGRNKKINVDYIVSIKQLPNKVSGIRRLNSVVFEISGRFASSYKLKDSEKVLNFTNNRITVSNSAEDKDTLILRLLKYGENCKILKPKEIQEEFIALTDEILKNLES